MSSQVTVRKELHVPELATHEDMRVDFARQNLRFYSRYLGYSNAPFHDKWYSLLQPMNDHTHFSPLREHPLAMKRFHLEGPRKHGKSQCVAINYPSWLIGNFPDIHITIVSKTATLAEQSLLEITARIEHDVDYREVFGDLKPREPQKWTGNQIYIKRHKISKFPTIQALGLGGPLTGGGADLIIADDIIDEQNVVTEAQRRKASTWFHKVLLTTLFPWGAVLAIGTRWHYADLYTEFLDKWNNEVLQAITNPKEYAEGKPAKVLWGDYWPIDRLEAKRNEIGSIFFQCQYQNDPTSMEGDILKSEWLHPYVTELPGKPVIEKFAGVDPSLGGGDLMAIATFGYHRAERQGYLIDVWTGKGGLPAFYRKLHELHRFHGYSKIFMESNVFQKVLVNHPELKGLPIVGTTTIRDKKSRFISMSSHFEAKRVLVNPSLLDQKSEFWVEWVQFPFGTYDDALDAPEIVIRNVIAVPKGFFSRKRNVAHSSHRRGRR